MSAAVGFRTASIDSPNAAARTGAARAPFGSLAGRGAWRPPLRPRGRRAEAGNNAAARYHPARVNQLPMKPKASSADQPATVGAGRLPGRRRRPVRTLPLRVSARQVTVEGAEVQYAVAVNAGRLARTRRDSGDPKPGAPGQPCRGGPPAPRPHQPTMGLLEVPPQTVAADAASAARADQESRQNPP